MAADGAPQDDRARANRLLQAERVALVVGLLFAVLGLATSGGCRAMPAGPPGQVPWAHLLLLALGIAAGVASTRRHRDIEADRWRYARDPHATKGEREHAHKEAERQRRLSATFFLLGPLGIAYWLAYHLESPGRVTAADLFLVTPVLGFLAGALLERLRSGPPTHAGEPEP